MPNYFLRKTHLAIIIFITIVILIAITIVGSLNLDLDIHTLVNHITKLSDPISSRPVVSFIAALLIYICICAVPFPLVSMVTLGIGYLFGFIQGIIIVSFGSAIGGLILFLFARQFLSANYLIPLITRFPRVKPLLESDDLFVATSIRFIPGLPFFLPSLVLSTTQLSAFRFYISTQLGLFFSVTIYTNAGDALAKATNQSLLSPSLLLSISLIGLLPMAYTIFNMIFKSKTHT